jgi:hypothetical protein
MQLFLFFLMLGLYAFILGLVRRIYAIPLATLSSCEGHFPTLYNNAWFFKIGLSSFIHLSHNACTSFTTCMQSGYILDPLLLLDVFKVIFFGSTLLNNIYY